MTALTLITGASRGLGLGMGRTIPFPSRVVGFSRSSPPADSDIEHVACDLSSPEGWSVLADSVHDLMGDSQFERTVLIHAAGTLTPIGFAGEVDGPDYQRNVMLNSASGQIVGHHYLEAVSGRPGRHQLVMISSGAASTPYRGWSAYGAGKAALDQWVRVVGAEQSHRGGAVVLSVAPGVLDTDMQAEIRESSEGEFPEVERFVELDRSGALVSPDEAARRLWKLLESDPTGGTVTDLRELDE